MPQGDQTGPTGEGPLTGRGKGICMSSSSGAVGQVSISDIFADLGPALKLMGQQYQKAAPTIDWLLEHRLLALTGLAALVFGAAAFGAWYGSKYLE